MIKKVIKRILVRIHLLVIPLGIIFLSCQPPTPIILTTGQDSYFRYEFVDVYISGGERLKDIDFRVLVIKNDSLVITIGDKKEIKMKYNSETDQWKGRWPVPWYASPGEYTLKLSLLESENLPIDTTFLIKRREPQKIQAGLCVVNWENMRPLRGLRLRCPDGELGGWKKIFDWLEWMGADALWFIAGQTSAYTTEICSLFPWNADNLEMIDDIAREAKRRGIKSGAWVSCYYIFGPKRYNPDYKFGWDYRRSLGTSVPTDAISILDERRLADIIEFTKKLYEIEELSYIGLDYIPDDYGAIELVDEFVSEMNVQLPDEWNKFSLLERKNWLGRIVKRPRNREIPLIDQWNWWRAHRISSIIRKISDGAEIKRPLWAFILSWERGWQHGQDPIMFQDAGVDINAVMLYQANCAQFNTLLRQWSRYIGRDDVNIVAGNQVDWFWHQNSLDPPGPLLFYNRLIRGINEMHQDGMIRGLFINDLSRAFWGIKGPYSTKEWVIASGASFSRLREQYRKIPIKTRIILPDSVLLGEMFKSEVVVENIGKGELRDLDISLLLPEDGIISVGEPKKRVEYLLPGETKRLIFKVQGNKIEQERDSRWMVASRVVSSKPNFSFGYVKVVPLNQEEI